MDYYGLAKLGKAAYIGLKNGKYGWALAKEVATPFMSFIGATIVGLVIEDLIEDGINYLEEKIYDSY